MIVLLRGEANRYSISMLMELAPDLPKISAARVQLRQVLMNPWPPLLRPWRKQVGVLAVNRQLVEDGQLLISVSDAGVRLPNKKTEQIWEYSNLVW